MRWITAALATLALVTSSVAYAGQAKVGSRASEFDSAAKDAKGKKFKLKAYRGKWVAVTFGGSWCKPCKKELPNWDKVAKEYAGRLTFIAVNIDDEIANGKKFMAGLKVKHMKVVYSPQETTDTASYYDPDTFPTTFIIDPKGVIRAVHEGYRDGDVAKLKKTLDKLLPSK
jgi:thiol-disulfide isomerase/thioredoxin